MLLVCVLLIAEFTSFSEGRLIVAGEDEIPAASSVKEQMYKIARALLPAECIKRLQDQCLEAQIPCITDSSGDLILSGNP
jgi:hypothetical protein